MMVVFTTCILTVSSCYILPLMVRMGEKEYLSYKTACVLVHMKASVDSIEESLLNKAGRR